MHRNNSTYKLSAAFHEKIFQFSAGYLPPDKIESALNIFQSEANKHFFTNESEANLIRIFSHMFEKASLIGDCVKYPHYAEILVAISSNSNYLTDILVRNPEYFYSITNPSDLKLKLVEDVFSKKLKARTETLKSFSSKLHVLRTIKRNEILKIGVKDILGLETLDDVTKQLSVLAKTIAAHLFSLCYDEIIQKKVLKKVSGNYSVLSLGKLGGRELNYSSDIDLIIFYDFNHKLSNSKSYEEFLTEVTHLFIESISSHSGDGFLYRVDFRLRPDGKNSPLCRSIGEYLNYYESKGEDWERQMLIKADYLAGSEELYSQFVNYLSAFIYPSSFRISPTEQIKKLKLNIEKNLDDDENIKLIPGGIRDIEFSVQALQLLNGGRLKTLRTGNTLNAITELQKEKIISGKESETLITSYKLYRKIEHFLQLMNDKQTHSIPVEGELLDKLVNYIGYENVIQFRKDISQKRKAVQSIYNSIVGSDSLNQKNKIIPDIKFVNKIKSKNDFDYLRQGTGLFGQKQFDNEIVNSFHKIEKQLIEYLSSSEQPDEVLNNFVRIIRYSNFPSIWYKAFSNKRLFTSFLNVCEFSQMSADLLANQLELQEFFLTKKVFEPLTKKSVINLSLNQLNLVLAVNFTLNKIKDEKISELLTHFYSHKIEKSAEATFKRELAGQKFFIASLGSFGTGEVNFHSDIDLLFIIDGSEQSNKSEKIFQKYFTLLKKEFIPIEVDCRLKPEGKNSPLVWSIEQYEQYLSVRARVWELQALTKINFVYGSKSLFTKFLKLIENRINTESQANIRNEIIDMRKKISASGIVSAGKSINIKKGQGGLIDIEFLIQFLILCNPFLFIKNHGQSLTTVLNIMDSSILNIEDKNKLKENYRFLKHVILIYQNLFNTKNIIINSEQKKISALAKLMGFESSTKFQLHLDSVLKQNKKLFEQYLMRG